MNKKLIFKKAIASFVFSLNSFLKINEEKEGFRVLMYHSVTEDFLKEDHYQLTVPGKIFEEQMRFLFENGYKVLSCDEIVDILSEGKGMPKKTVCITFDDGFRDILTNALPILEKYHFKATAFLTTGFIEKDKAYLGWDDIKSLLKTELFSLGSHSFSHRKLFKLDLNSLDAEMGLSKRILEDKLAIPIHFFAYPFGCYGSFDKRAKDFVRAQGYKAAFTTIAGFNTFETDLFEIKRTRISWYDDQQEFPKELLAAYDWYGLWQKISKTR